MRYQVNIPDGVSGDYKVVNEGSATKLYQLIDSEWLVIMEDSELEAEQADSFLTAATGDVLVAGLGLGMVVQPLIDNNSVTSVTIVEKFQEVTDLVWSHVPQSSKVRLISGDIHTWTPDKDFDVAWFDSFICPIDGTDSIGPYLTTLKNKYQASVGSGYFWPYTRGW